MQISYQTSDPGELIITVSNRMQPLLVELAHRISLRDSEELFPAHRMDNLLLRRVLFGS